MARGDQTSDVEPGKKNGKKQPAHVPDEKQRQPKPALNKDVSSVTGDVPKAKRLKATDGDIEEIDPRLGRFYSDWKQFAHNAEIMSKGLYLVNAYLETIIKKISTNHIDAFVKALKDFEGTLADEEVDNIVRLKDVLSVYANGLTHITPDATPTSVQAAVAAASAGPIALQTPTKPPTGLKDRNSVSSPMHVDMDGAEGGDDKVEENEDDDEDEDNGDEKMGDAKGEGL
ncbi:hypothetical protein MBLNU457_7835t1 [Dothideomycetes sp. NU457]